MAIDFRSFDRAAFMVTCASAGGSIFSYTSQVRLEAVMRGGKIVIGDSFTYGGKVQLDDTLPKRLDKNLNLNINQY